MNPEQEEFAELHRLLALKRHEQPPPGYFIYFSGQVIARIRAGERLEEESLLHRVPWLERLWIALETKPVFAGAFGIAVCSLLVSGIIYTERAEPLLTVGIPAVEEPSAQVAHISSETLSPLFQGTGRSDSGLKLEQPRPSLFQEYKELRQLREQPLFAPVSDRQPAYLPGVN